MQVNILGTPYEIVESNSEEDRLLEDCDGYCDWTVKKIVIRREIDGNLNDMESYIQKVKRHEIIHAFLFESGLAHASASVDAWAVNEEMVDWFARKGQQIFKAWIEADALFKTPIVVTSTCEEIGEKLLEKLKNTPVDIIKD